MARTINSPKNTPARSRASACWSPQKLTNSSVHSGSQKGPGHTSPLKPPNCVVRSNPRNPVNAVEATSKCARFTWIWYAFFLSAAVFCSLEKRGIVVSHGTSFPHLQALRANNTPTTASNAQTSAQTNEPWAAPPSTGGPNLAQAAPSLLPSSRGVQAYGNHPFGPDLSVVSRSPGFSPSQGPPPAEPSIFVDILGHGLCPSTPLCKNVDDLALFTRPAPIDGFQVNTNPLAITGLNSVPILGAEILTDSPLPPSSPSISLPAFESNSVTNSDSYLVTNTPLPPSSPATISLVSPESTPSRPKCANRPSQRHAIYGHVQGAFRGSRQWDIVRDRSIPPVRQEVSDSTRRYHQQIENIICRCE
ncbi:hypothetical protein GYMLUDRAFT_64797 [Collybiopsis luxurians FD-317 M1]|uniref:Uncharacterized protein n=1 Tax=Collybiopsis luxurians FD-317 M1 TaxID=944289 RepID=A0A0D0BB38_9AGAR|nr:hypothetical protein GYMLUDRAFT_64797 [Collybiopsis luxurians FD-317 M1]